MNTRNYTSIEQSKKLLELGLSPESADMFYFLTKDKQGNEMYSVLPHFADESDAVREFLMKLQNILWCWSVGALLEVMPTIKKDFDTYIPYITKGSVYYCSYAFEADGLVELKSFSGQSVLDACYNMVVWLLENNYIKND